MKETSNAVEQLLSRSFLAGLAGILSCVTPLVLFAMQWPGQSWGNYLTGLGLALQLLGLSLAVLALRKKNLTPTQKEKAKKMVLVLGVSLLFFMLV